MAEKSGNQAPIYEIRITLRGSKPPIWRRVAVPSDLTLAELHEIVQIAMGWMDEHLHQFRMKVATRRPGPADVMRLMGSGRWDELELLTRGERTFTDLGMADMDAEDERHFTLGELCRKVKDRLLYEYDFGDGWEHTIAVFKIYAPKDAVRYPVCLAGKGACPPEDCGGVGGYYNMLDAVADPKHPAHEEYRDWLSDDFDPEAFDVEEVNAILSQWRRHPRVRKPAGGSRKKRKTRGPS